MSFEKCFVVSLQVSEAGYDVFKVRIVGAKNLAKKDIFGLR